MTRQAIRAALLLIAALTLLPLLAMAQPAPAASAPAVLTAADITFDRACGAGGVGRQFSAANGRAQGEIHRRQATPGQRVGPAPHGYWSKCAMPPRPKDCAARLAPMWTGKGGYVCKPVPGRMIPSRDAPYGHDVGADPRWPNKGIQYWRCDRWPDGKTEWRERPRWPATCSPRR